MFNDDQLIELLREAEKADCPLCQRLQKALYQTCWTLILTQTDLDIEKEERAELEERCNKLQNGGASSP